MITWLLLVSMVQPSVTRSALEAIVESQNRHLPEIVCKFFEDQPTLRVFNFDETPLTIPRHAILSHSQSDLKILDDMGYDVSNPRTNMGYVVLSDFEFFKSGLESFAKINTNGRWLFLLNHSISTSNISSLLTTAWITHNMLNILVVHQSTAYFYDPFVPNLLQLNISTDSFDFDKFQFRTHNAQGFRVKIEAVSRRMGYPLEEIYHVYDNLLDYLMRYINATPEEVTELPVIPQISVKSPNGLYVGAHNRINRSSVALSMTSHTVIPMGRSNVAYLYPTRKISYSYVVKSRAATPKLIELRIWNEFAEYVELLCVSAIVLIWFLVEQFGPRSSRGRHGFSRVVVDINCILSGGSIRLFQREQHSLRILVWVLLFYSMIVNNTFQGRVITKLSLPQYAENIETLEELAATNFSIYSGFSSLYHKTNSPTLHKLIQRNIHISEANEVHQIFQKRSDMAFLITQRSINYHQATFYDPKTGDYLIHRIPNIVVDFLGAFLVQRNSAFLVEFNRAALQAFENGFLEYADKRFKLKLAILKVKRQLKRLGVYGDKKGQKAIRMANLKDVFNLYVHMLVAAIGVFVVEVVWFQTRKKMQRINKFRRICGVLDKIGNIL